LLWKKIRAYFVYNAIIDKNVAQIFVDILQKDVEKVWSSIEVKAMINTEEDKLDFEKGTQCWICQKQFDRNDKLVTTVISLENAQVQVTTNAICFTENRNLFQLYFII